jgi:hypothetical protein
MNRLLKYLEQQDKQLTVGDLIEQINQKQELDKQKEIESTQKCIDKYKNCYLKRKRDCTLFGKTLDIYYIKKIEARSKDIYMNTLYNLYGKKISFSEGYVNITNINTPALEASFNEDELNKMEMISQIDYKLYLKKCKSIIKESKDILE